MVSEKVTEIIDKYIGQRKTLILHTDIKTRAVDLKP